MEKERERKRKWKMEETKRIPGAVDVEERGEGLSVVRSTVLAIALLESSLVPWPELDHA